MFTAGKRTIKVERKRQHKRLKKSNLVSRRRVRVPLPLGGFPNKMRVRLKYVDQITLNAAAVSAAIHVFRANSLYDPDYTSTGHQPSNFDKLATIYDRYTVTGAFIRVYPVYPAGTSVTPPPQMAIHLSEDGTDLSTAYSAGGLNNVLEQPKIARNIKSLANANSGGPWSWTRKFSAYKFFGVKDVVGESPYSADIAANPAEGAFFEVGAFSVDGSNDPVATVLRVEIEYIATMTEPKLADAS